MKNILITGAAGFIGKHLCEKLTDKHVLYPLDALTTDASKKRMTFLSNLQTASIHSDFIDKQTTKPDIVIHLAAETGISGSLNNPALYFHQNVEGTFNVLEQCRKNGVKYLIYASSSSVYEPNEKMPETAPHDKQLSFYGTSKRMTEVMIENYCRQFGMVAIGLRFFTVYGSWTRSDMAAYKFMTAIDNGNPITLYNEGNVYRDFTHVSDIVSSIELLCEKIVTESEGTHRVFNIGFGAPVSVKKYAELIARHLEKDLLAEYKSLPSNELTSTHSDTAQLEAYIHYKPMCTIEKGIKEMTDWFKVARY
jgi:UDP-glucuronate 4-epimerase